MVSIIPLSVGQRRLDTGNAPQYPQGSPIGGAMQGLGDQFSAVAERYQQIRDQQEAFDAELKRRQFIGQIAQAEDEVAANAPPDGAGLHETMYGEVDPRNGRVVKTGLFDTLFDAALPGMPESQRANFAGQKEAMRAVGARRLAQRQLERRRDYEQTEGDTALKTSAIAIGKADPDDHASFDAARQEGLDLIDKMGVDPGIRQQKVKDWFGTAAKARFEALIAKDPKRALEMFGVGAPGESSESDASGIQSVSWMRASGGSEATAAKSDRVGKPDERVAQAFADSVPAGDPIALKPATGPLADLSPDDVRRLIDRAHAANTAQLIEARTNIALASQNAPDAIANTGIYAGKMPDPADFAAVYGTEEGGKRFQDFSRQIDVGRQAFGMRTVPNQAIHATLRDAEPGPGSSEEDRARFRTTAAAALKILGMRRADPAGYVREVFPNVDAAWSAATSPDSMPENGDAYKWAIAVSVAAQRQLGVENPQPLPSTVVQSLVDTLGNKDVPQAEKGSILHDLLAAARDPVVRDALSQQLDQAGLSGPAQVDPVVTTATGRPPSAPPSEAWSRFQRTAEDFGDYLSEGFEALGRIPHDIGLGIQDLRDSPWGFLEQLPVTPGSGAVAEGRLAVEAVGEAVAKGLAIVRGGTGKFAKPLEKLAANGSRAASDVSAEGTVARQTVDAESRAVNAANEAAYRLSTGAKPDKAELLEIIKSIARDPSKIKYEGASFGKALSKNYRKTFLDANPKLEGEVVVHHAAEQQILHRYLGLVTEEEMHSLQNLRGIPKSLDNLLHNKIFRFEWDEFYASHPQPTRQQVLDYVEYIDKKYGHLFNPPIGG
ncbi:hypothetical protein [Mesorhizobium erdmanii]|uniref:hypothetical protein n=1 Tax=Mesorhizobium erdmanii TaxID=1777866 RepID=UPI001ADF1E9B|nr:hypothetical protein [Mesorhizobium erdmanii]